MLHNTALWLHAKATALSVDAAVYTAPAADVIVIRAIAVSVNTMDRFMQTVGCIVASWVQYPFVLGSDVVGGVVACLFRKRSNLVRRN
jgi:NADPH:quinone reductase-like Zn-dependent oxidoreductase